MAGLQGRGIQPQCSRVPRNRKCLLFSAKGILAGHACFSRKGDPRDHGRLEVVHLVVPRQNHLEGPLAVVPVVLGKVLCVVLWVRPSVIPD